MEVYEPSACNTTLLCSTIQHRLDSVRSPFQTSIGKYKRYNKKVLLRERKRHTDRRVASTPSVVLTGWGYPIPGPDRGRGVPYPWMGGYPHLWTGGQGWMGVPPVQGWMGVPPPPSGPGRGTPPRVWTDTK